MKLARAIKFIGMTVFVCITGYLIFTHYWGRGQVTKVQTITLKASPADLVLAVVGRVRSQEVVNIRAERPGAITALVFDEGQSVQKGEVLAHIRSEEEQVSLTVNQAQLEALNESVKLAQIKLNRTVILAEKGFLAQSALDEAKASFKTAMANQKAAQASLNQAIVRVGEFDIRSPMSGIVLSRPLDAGQVVGTSDVIFQIGSEGLIEIKAEVDEYYAESLRINMKAFLSPSGSEEVFDGQIYEIAPRVDPLTGGRMIRLLPEQSNSVFLPGRSIDVNIIAQHFDQALSVPRRALNKQEGKWKVYIAQNDKAESRIVAFVDWPGSFVVITSGLKAGDSVVLDPLQISDGMKLEIIEMANSIEKP